jgi:hypothetical protein
MSWSAEPGERSAADEHAVQVAEFFVIAALGHFERERVFALA